MTFCVVNFKIMRDTKCHGGRCIYLTEKELVELIKEIKEEFPNEFFEILGYMKGLKLSSKNRSENK